MPLRYQTPSDFAAAVLSALKDDKRSKEWLAGEAGIPSSTLHSQLVENPERLSYKNALRIAEVVALDPLAPAS